MRESNKAHITDTLSNQSVYFPVIGSKIKHSGSKVNLKTLENKMFYNWFTDRLFRIGIRTFRHRADKTFWFSSPGRFGTCEGYFGISYNHL